MQRIDTVQEHPAWYRQFWPWFLISIPAATVLACLYTIFLAVTTSDSLVVRSDSGVDVATERLIAAEKAAAAQGLRADLTLDAASGLITLEIDALPESQRYEALTLEFSHPAFAARDHAIELLPAPSDAGAVFIGQRRVPLDERWYLVLTHADWRMTGVWNGGNAATLTARGAR